MRFDGFEHLLSHFAETSPDAPALRDEKETLGSAALYARVKARAAELKADTENAENILITDENSRVTIAESGTYIVSGSASDGSITVKKGTAGVVLILRDLDTRTLSQKLQRVAILQIFHPADEGHHIAAHAAAEAPKGLRCGKDDKGGRFLTVEGTKSLLIRARTLQRHVGADHVLDVVAIADLFYYFSWNHLMRHTSGIKMSWYRSSA